jgi:DNA-binding IclR family transcriptional regulator
VLNLLAREPDEPLTASEIARRLELNLATCQSILATLTETGLLIRLPEDRTFALGPALVRLGDAARSLNPALAVVGEALERLHADTGYGCVAAVAQADRLVVTRRVGARGSFPVPAFADGAWPLSAPIGITTMAWRTQREIDAWFEGTARADDDEYRARMVRVEAAIRETGWCVWQPGSTAQLSLPQFESLLDSVGDGHERELMVQLVQRLAFAGTEAYLPEELTGKRRVSVGLITASVWNVGADPSIEVALHVFQESMPVAEVRRLAERVASVRAEVSGQM